MLCTEAINNKQTSKILRIMASGWKSQTFNTTVIIMVVNSYKNAVIMFFSLCNWTKVFCWYSGHKSAGLWRQEWVNAIPEVTHSVAVLWDIHTTTRNTEMVLVITLFSSMYQQSSCTVFNIWFRAMVSGWQPVKTYELHSLKSVGNQAISYNFAGIKISGKKGPLPFCWNISLSEKLLLKSQKLPRKIWS